MRFSRRSLIALLTVGALGVLAAVALASGGDNTTTAPRPTSETDPPAQTRSAPSDDDGTADQGSGDAPATPGADRPDNDVSDDRGRDDAPNHDIDDDRGGEDHGSRGPGSSNSGHGGGDD